MSLIFRLNGWLVRLLSVLAVVVIAAMALGVSAEVVLRMLSFPSISGLIELTEYGLFISTFFIAPYLLRTGEHIRVDIAVSRVGPAAARRVEYFTYGAIIAVSLVTGAVSLEVMIGNIRAGTMIFKDLVIPQWWLDWIIPLTALAMALQALELLMGHYTSQRPDSHEGADHVPGLRPEELP